MAQAPERVLSTLNVDGTRRWIRPKFTKGGFWWWRRTVAYGLMVVFFAIPYLTLNGKPLILLDIPRRQFTIFSQTFCGDHRGRGGALAPPLPRDLF